MLRFVLMAFLCEELSQNKYYTNIQKSENCVLYINIRKNVYKLIPIINSLSNTQCSHFQRTARLTKWISPDMCSLQWKWEWPEWPNLQFLREEYLRLWVKNERLALESRLLLWHSFWWLTQFFGLISSKQTLALVTHKW